MLYRATADVIPDDWQQECQTSSDSSNNGKVHNTSIYIEVFEFKKKLGLITTKK